MASVGDLTEEWSHWPFPIDRAFNVEELENRPDKAYNEQTPSKVRTIHGNWACTVDYAMSSAIMRAAFEEMDAKQEAARRLRDEGEYTEGTGAERLEGSPSPVL
jgi:hypothetical protein